MPLRARFRLFLAGLALCLSAATGRVQTPSPELAFPTGPPRFIEPATPAATQALISRAEFDQLLSKLRQIPAFVVLPDEPRVTAADTLFGFNFTFNGRNHAFAVTGSETAGFEIIADLNANGTIGDDEPLRTERRDGYHTAFFTTVVTDTIDGEQVSYPVRIKFVLSLLPTPGGLRLGWATYNNIERTGLIQFADRRVAFALIGRPGAFHQPGSDIWFDLDGDGERSAAERFDVADKRVSLGAHSYAFAVDPAGRSLSLRPLDATLPNLSPIELGVDAPGVRVTDIDGRSHSIADYRGKVVLLDFWAVWCGPCRIEASELNRIYAASHAAGLEIIGIGPDSRDDIVKFQAQFGYAWPQVSESYEGEAHRLYRVQGYPAHFLIGRDGKVAAVQLGGFDGTSFPNAIAAALEAR